jgi:hypothetical protein
MDRSLVRAETLERRTIITCVRGYFRDRARQQGEDGEHAR